MISPSFSSSSSSSFSNNSQMRLLETLIFTQIGSVGARDVPFQNHYATICTSPHDRYAKYQTVNKDLERDAIF